MTSNENSPERRDYEGLIDEAVMNKQYYLGMQSSLCPPLLDLELLAGTLACPTQTQLCASRASCGIIASQHTKGCHHGKRDPQLTL